jgi:hypothetical protein
LKDRTGFRLSQQGDGGRVVREQSRNIPYQRKGYAKKCGMSLEVKDCVEDLGVTIFSWARANLLVEFLGRKKVFGSLVWTFS